MKTNFLLLFPLATMLSYVLSFKTCQKSIQPGGGIPYDLGQPEKKYVLKQNLEEVSGLSLSTGNSVALVQDEAGILFFFDFSKGSVSHRIHFGKRGDYEDVQMVNDTAYILRSDGILFEVTRTSSGESPVVRKFPTGLTRANNTEGLCYDDRNHRMLIACKNRPGKGKNTEQERAVYSFDLRLRTLSDTPVVRIKINDVQKLADGPAASAIQRIVRFYQGVRQQSFQPSGLAIHPQTRDLYIISSVGNMLAVMDSTSKLTQAVRLPNEIFKQPEGIAFDTAGNLYVSNEGRKGKGNILKFSFLKK